MSGPAAPSPALNLIRVGLDGNRAGVRAVLGRDGLEVGVVARNRHA